MLYGESNQQHSVIFTLLAVNTAAGLANGDDLNFATGVNVTATTSTPTTAGQFKLETSGTAAQNVRNTALNMVAAINRAGGNNVYAYYLSGANESPGKVLVVRAPHTANTELNPNTNGKRSAFYPAFGPRPRTLYNLSRTGSVVTATATVGTHNLVAGDVVTLTSPSANFGAGPHTITAASTTTFTYTEAGTATTSSNNTFRVDFTFVSSNDTQMARVFESKPFQPEAFPALNYADVGDPTKRVLAMAVVRNQVFAFKDDGLFIRTAPLTWELFDGTVKLAGIRAICTLLNNIYAWTTQGIVSINDTGVEIVSRPVENIFTKALTLYPSEVKEKSFAVADEKERTVHFYTPSATGSVYPLQAYTFDTITRVWTSENVSNTQFLTGATFTAQNKATYRGVLTIGGVLYLQRNTNTQADYQDIPGTAQTIDSFVSSSIAVFLSDPGFIVTDVVNDNLGNIYYVTGVEEDPFAPGGGTWNVTVTPTMDTMTVTTLSKATSINTQWTYAPITAGNPDSLKLFRGLTVLFQNAHFRTLGVSYSTELRTTAQTQNPDIATLAAQWSVTWDTVERPYNLSLLIPQEMRRATRLNLTLSTLNRACSVFAVNGISIRLSPSGDKVSK